MPISRLPPSRRVWIFDLDNTLHDARAHIFPAMHEQMNAWLRGNLGLDEDGANALRRTFWEKYGTTLAGLVRHYGTDPRKFIMATHEFPELADLVVRENALRHALALLPGRKVIFSNAPRHYVDGVVKALGIARFFDAIYTIESTRGIDGGNEILAGYRGTVMCDGYAVYKAIEKAAVGLKLAHCWAHFRREILAHEQAYPQIVAEGLALIRNLYAIEDACRDEPDEVRRAHRDSLSRAVVEEIQRWMLSTWGAVPPGSGLRGALTYGAGLWSGLSRFLEEPKIGLDNNPSERAARGPVVGRKNHYGSRSKRGTEVAALFYTLLESAKLAGVEPKAYLRAATLASLNGDVIPLPHEWNSTP